ncbi:MAG TPA: hypothetical protein VIO11_00005, partial [Candidatus Methanoperedens sp.]
GEVAHRTEIVRGVLLGLDWSGALMEVSLFGKDIRIRKAAESMVGCLSLGGHGSDTKEYRRIPLNNKAIVIDLSALLSILDKNAPAHEAISSEFLRLVNNRIMIICHEETLLSLASQIFARDISVADGICNHVRGCLLVSSSKKNIFKLARDLGKGLDNESLHAIDLSKIIGAPLFTSSHRVLTAFEKIRNSETS